MLTVISYTIYHSPNAYLGVVLADRALAGLPVRVERRPIFIPHSRGIKVADLVGSTEPPRKSSYHREDCARWAAHYGIEMHFLPAGTFEERATRWRQSPFGREELPARAYYASRGTGQERAFDLALFRAAWIDGLDVNDKSVIRAAAQAAGLDPDVIMERALGDEARRAACEALTSFDREEIPGVPTWVMAGKRFWGKDRVDWVVRELDCLLRSAPS